MLLFLKHFFIEKPQVINFNFIEEQDLNPAKDVEKINKKLKSIKTIVYNNIKITIRNNFYFKATGQLYFQNDKKLRIKISSIFGKEMDIGSNEEFFWFWSKRMVPSALYYSNHRDLHKSNLKAVFNYDWIMESFGFQAIDIKNAQFLKLDKLIVIKQRKVSNNGEVVFLLTKIDSIKNIVLSRQLCNSDNKVIASVEFKHFLEENNTLKEIVISWYEENIFMYWEIEKVEINSEIDKDAWLMPKSKFEIDISK